MLSGKVIVATSDDLPLRGFSFSRAQGPLYQLRDFLDAYDDNLQQAMTPGRHLCVDESMNQ